MPATFAGGEASREELRYFLKQEVAGKAGFDDLVALAQIQLPTEAKLEPARNDWDEMGRGREGHARTDARAAGLQSEEPGTRTS